MDVRMPDGVLVKNVPDGISQEELLELYGSSSGATQPPAQQSGYNKFIDTLRNPQTGGKGGVVGPAIVGGAGELIKGAGALTQLAFPDAGQRMVETGQAMTEGAKSVSPVSATVGQVGSYIAPFGAVQRAGSAVASLPKVADAIGAIPSFVRSTVGQGTAGAALGYGLTPDSENREKSALYGGGFGAATPTLGLGISKLAQMLRGKVTPNTQQGVDEAIDAGYKIPPSQVNNSIIGRALEGMSGKAATAQNASLANQQTTNRLASRALGLSDDTMLNVDKLKEVRKEAGEAYKAIENTGLITPDKKYYSALDDIKKPFVKIAQSFPDQTPSPVIKFVDSLKSDYFDASAAVANIKQLRTMADDAFKKGETDLSKAYKQSASAMEDAIETHLTKTKETELLADFRAARRLIAKTYSVEKALNPAGGNVDAKKIASQLNKKPLEAELKTIGEFGARFPKAAQTTEAMGSLPQVSPLDYALALGAGGLNYAGGSAEGTLGATPLIMAATLAARPAARSAVLSKTAQKTLLQGKTGSMNSELARALMMQSATKYGASKDKEEKK